MYNLCNKKLRVDISLKLIWQSEGKFGSCHMAAINDSSQILLVPELPEVEINFLILNGTPRIFLHFRKECKVLVVNIL